jgi:hypothetical protein
MAKCGKLERYGFRLLKSMHVPMQTDQAKRVLEEVASGAGQKENGLSFDRCCKHDNFARTASGQISGKLTKKDTTVVSQSIDSTRSSSG